MFRCSARAAEFIENKGQWPAQVKFRALLPQGAVYVTHTGLTFYLFNLPTNHPEAPTKAFLPSNHIPGPSDPAFQTKINAHVYRVNFKGMNPNASFLGQQPYRHVSNFLLGGNPAHWGTDARSYQEVFIKNLYPGVDLQLLADENLFLKYNFILQSDQLLSQIQLEYEGIDSLRLEQGNLTFETSVRKVQEFIPLSFYRDGAGEQVPIKYQLSGKTVRFRCETPQTGRPLTIDPKLIFSSYSGSSADNWGFTATYDPLGNGYSGGIVFGSGFPSTTGALQVNFGGGVDVDFSNGDISRDMGILKYAPDGKSLVYATYVGGSHNEQPHSMIVNNAGELCILGTTYSTDFPGLTNFSYQRSNNGESDIILLKMRPDGKSISSATYFGGNLRDGLNGQLNSSDQNISSLGWNYGDIFRGEINVDAQDNIYIASSTQSGNGSNFPLKNAEWGTFGGGLTDGIAACFSPNLQNLQWSTYMGGSGADAAYGIYIYNGFAYICGGTGSSDFRFPASSGVTPYQSNFNGGQADGFAAILRTTNGRCDAATYMGTPGYDQAFLVQADKYGNPYFFGQSNGSEWPVTVQHPNFQNRSQFILKLDNQLKSVSSCITFGSGRPLPDISPSAFLVDKCGRVFISGWGGRVNNAPRGHNGNTKAMWISPNAFDSQTDGSDFYLAVFNRDLDSLVYGTYFGGEEIGADGLPLAEHVDGGTSRFDYEGRVYQSVCAGCGGSDAFPTTPGAHSTANLSTNCNNALFKIDFENLNSRPSGEDKILEITAGDTISYVINSYDNDKGDSLFLTRSGVIFGNGIQPPLAQLKEVSGKGYISSTLSWMPWCQHASNDTYYVKVMVRDDNACPSPDTSFSIIKIKVSAPPLIKPPDVVCVAHLDPTTLRISWDRTDENKYFKYYLLYRRDPQGNMVTLDTIFKNSPQEYIDLNTPNHQFQNYCYFMQGVNICDKYGDTSYKACSADEFSQPIDSVYLYSASVRNNVHIQVKWLASKETDFGSYLIFRKSGNGNWNYIKSKYIREDTTFIDSAVAVNDSSYCYSIRTTDKCGHISNYSNEGCTILLKGKSLPYIHSLEWSEYSRWMGGVEQYELVRADSLPGLFNKVGSVNGNTLNTVDTSMNYDWGQYTYMIRAREGIKGWGAMSNSNWVVLGQNPLLWVPEAFSPNGDGINDEWKWVSIFVKTFHIKLYNRWGELIFETTDKHDYWKGLYRNREFHNNVYVWYVEYSGWDDSKHNQSGTLTVLQ